MFPAMRATAGPDVDSFQVNERVADETNPGGRFALYPAIDLRRGRCVRLEKGRADRETVYGGDPHGVAAGFVAAGARWIHVVDLDAALGDGSNRALVRDLASSVAVRVQTGGGLRTEEDLAEVDRKSTRLNSSHS